MITRQELKELGRKLAQAEHEVATIKNEIIERLGIRAIVGYGSVMKIDWQKIKRGLAPFPWIDDQLARMGKTE